MGLTQKQKQHAAKLAAECIVKLEELELSLRAVVLAIIADTSMGARVEFGPMRELADKLIREAKQ